MRRGLVIAAALVLAVLLVPLLLHSGHRSRHPEPAAAPPSSRVSPSSSPDWKLTFSDSFLGNRLDPKKWHAYDGVPRGGQGEWDSSLVSVHNGMLVLRSQKVDGEWLTAGVSSARAGSQRYGRWAVRFRIEAGNGIGYALLLYPTDDTWPPEIDFAEDGGGSRQSSMGTLHYGAKADPKQVHTSIKIDNTAWHTMGVIVEPGMIQYTLDGQVWATQHNAAVPDKPLWLGMQTQLKTCQKRYVGTCMDGSETGPIDLDIDYVARWVRA